MYQIRKSSERGYFDHGWLKTYHSFSFGDYFDPKHHEFHSLRVINEDWVAPNIGFPKHPHKDMEILTYILKGSLKHEDSMGNSSTIQTGEFQRMTAGTGVFHSEMNPSDTPVHLLQIWVLPAQKGLKPGYEQRGFDSSLYQNQFFTVASGTPVQDQLLIHQDVSVSVAQLDAGKKLDVTLEPKRAYYIHLIEGEATIGKQALRSGDALKIESEMQTEISASSRSHLLMFNLQVNSTLNKEK